MASPYFTPIQTKTADYSPIVQAGQAEGEMYASIGQALGSVASTYFRKEKTKAKAKQAVANGGARAILLNANFDEESINTMSPEDQLKIITGAIDDVGLDNFARTQMEMTQARQTAANQEILREQNEIILSQSKRQEEKFKRHDEINRHYHRRLPDGSVAFNLDGFQNWNEYAAEIGEFSKGRNIEGFSSANFASFIDQSNVDPTDRQALIDLGTKWSSITGAGTEEQKRVQDLAMTRYIDPMDIQKDFSDYLNSDPSIKGIIEAQTSFEQIGATLPEAFKKDKTGKVIQITNTTAMMNFRRALAKIGNGAGVMTDKDVDDYMGETDVVATWKRKFNEYFGDGTEEGKSSELSVEDADQLNRLYTVVREFHDKKARQAYKDGIVSVDRKYQNLDRRKIMSHLSPKFTRDLMGVQEGINQGADSVTDLNVKKEVKQAIRRYFEDGKTYEEAFDEFQRHNTDMSEERIHAMLGASVGKEYNPADGDQDRRFGGASDKSRNLAAEKTKQLQDDLKGEIELLGDQNTVHPLTSGAQGAVGFMIGESAVAGAKASYNLAVRQFGKDSRVAKLAKQKLDAGIRRKFMGGTASKEVYSSVAKELGIKTTKRNGEKIADKKLYEQARQKLMKRMQSPAQKTIMKKLFTSKGALARWGGRFATGGLMLAYDLANLPKELDGEITEGEVQELVDELRTSPEYADQPPEFFQEVYESLSPELQSKSKYLTYKEAFTQNAKDKNLPIGDGKMVTYMGKGGNMIHSWTPEMIAKDLNGDGFVDEEDKPEGMPRTSSKPFYFGK